MPADRDISNAALTRPSIEDERRALVWLMDVTTHGGPLDRRYAATIIDTLAWFEQQEANRVGIE